MKTRGPATRIYADTSVFGGGVNDEFIGATEKFFRLVRKGVIRLVASPLVADEIEPAPQRVTTFFRELESDIEFVPMTPAAVALMRAYVAAGIVTQKWAADAMHVALATTAACSIIVSWNLKHIANYRRILLYNAVNRQMGYAVIAILTPLEVTGDEDERDS